MELAKKFVERAVCEGLLPDLQQAATYEDRHRTLTGFFADHFDLEYLHNAINGSEPFTKEERTKLLARVFHEGTSRWVREFQKFRPNECSVQKGSNPPGDEGTTACATVGERDSEGVGVVRQQRLCFYLVGERGGGMRFRELGVGGGGLIAGLIKKLKMPGPLVSK